MTTDTIPEWHATCFFCGRTSREIGCTGWINAPHYDRAAGAWHPERIHVCSDQTCRDQIGTKPRAPRRPRQPRPLYGDFAQLAAFHGITTDGTGRVNRRSAR